MKTYRIAILGCRGRGTAAARAYHAHPRTEIVGLCDLIHERYNALGKELNVSALFTDLDEMILQTSPDIVAIPTATELHYDLCMQVLEHGVHIEVEKPMCVDLDQADAAGLETGFVQRSCKLNGSCFTQMLVFSLLENPDATYTQMSQIAGVLGTSITRQTIEQRFTPEAAETLRFVLDAAASTIVSTDPQTLPLLEKFNGVYLIDMNVKSFMMSVSAPFTLGAVATDSFSWACVTFILTFGRSI